MARRARVSATRLKNRCRAAGVLPLVGHGTLRVCVAGQKARNSWTAASRRQSSGCSTMRSPPEPPGFRRDSCTLPERVRRPKNSSVCAASSPGTARLYATHMRDYGDRLVEAVDEQLELARRTGCRLQISHLQAVGPRNWQRQQAALDRIETARAEGMDVAFDCYPYTRGSTVSDATPAADGRSKVARRNWWPASRIRARGRQSRRTPRPALAQGWDGIFVASIGSARNQPLVGKTIAEIAKIRGVAPGRCRFDLLVEERGQVNMLEINQSEDNLRQILGAPLSNIISDGFYVHGRPHPDCTARFHTCSGPLHATGAGSAWRKRSGRSRRSRRRGLASIVRAACSRASTRMLRSSIRAGLEARRRTRIRRCLRTELCTCFGAAG